MHKVQISVFRISGSLCFISAVHHPSQIHPLPYEPHDSMLESTWKGHRTQFIFRSPRGKERPAQFIPPKEEEIAGHFPQQGARQAAVEPEGAVPLDNALHYCPNCTEGEIDPVSDAQWLNNKITDKKPLSVRRVCREQGPHRTQNWVLPTVCPWHHLYQCLRGLQA